MGHACGFVVGGSVLAPEGMLLLQKWGTIVFPALVCQFFSRRSAPKQGASCAGACKVVSGQKELAECS